MATDDEDKARDAIEKAAKGEGKAESYKDHDYYSFDGDGAAGIVDGWVVLGDPGGFKAAVDTAEGGAPIEDDDALHADARGRAARSGSASCTSTPPRSSSSCSRSGAGAALGPFAGLFKDPVLATLNANEHGVRFEATLPESLSSAFPLVAEGNGLRGRAAGRLVARPGAARPRQDDRATSSTRSAPSPAAAT